MSVDFSGQWVNEVHDHSVNLPVTLRGDERVGISAHLIHLSVCNSDEYFDAMEKQSYS